MNDSNISTSKIMLKSFISYYQLKEYMALLLQAELINHVNKERTFMITNKGMHFLEMYDRLMEDYKDIGVKTDKFCH